MLKSLFERFEFWERFEFFECAAAFNALVGPTPQG
jgi:hypothetical protein